MYQCDNNPVHSQGYRDTSELRTINDKLSAVLVVIILR